MNGVMNRLIPLVFAAITFSAVNAGAASFRFEQAGFDEGAQLIGEFSGTDANGDHRLTVETLPGGLTGSGPPAVIDNELDLLTVRFTGNSAVGAFTLDLSAVLQTQFGIPCCGPGESYAFYFDLTDTLHLEFVAMSASEVIMLVNESAFGTFALAGEACSFVNGGGGCASSSGAPYAPQISAVPVPSPLLLLLSAVGALYVRAEKGARKRCFGERKLVAAILD